MFKTHGQVNMRFSNSPWNCDDLNPGYPWSHLKHLKLDTPYQIPSYSQVIFPSWQDTVQGRRGPIWLPLVICYLILLGFPRFKNLWVRTCMWRIPDQSQKVSSSDFWWIIKVHEAIRNLHTFINNLWWTHKKKTPFTSWEMHLCNRWLTNKQTNHKFIQLLL